MTLEEFHNGLRLLRSIDFDEVDSPAWYGEFCVDPYMYFIRCSDDTAKKIWAAMVKRGAVKPAPAQAPENCAHIKMQYDAETAMQVVARQREVIAELKEHVRKLADVAVKVTILSLVADSALKVAMPGDKP